VNAGTFVAIYRDPVFKCVKSNAILLHPATPPFGVAEFVDNYVSWATWIQTLCARCVIKRCATKIVCFMGTSPTAPFGVACCRYLLYLSDMDTNFARPLRDQTLRGAKLLIINYGIFA